MAKQVTEAFTLNNAWKNLLTQALADGYTGGMIVQGGYILNFNDTAAYVHLHTSGSTNPTTAADGLTLSKDATVGPSSIYHIPAGTDISCVWIHTAGNQTIKYGLVGK